ncbi:hypothetical protein D3C84_896460 [compost metagenome]
MLNLMRCPIPSVCPAREQAVKRCRTCIHNRRTMPNILQIRQEIWSCFNHRQQNTFHEPIHHGGMLSSMEILFKHMGHHIHDAIDGLIQRHRGCISRIQNRKSRISQWTAPASLLIVFPVRNHRDVIHFRARRGER